MGQKCFCLRPSLRCRYRAYEIVIWVFLTWHSLALSFFSSLFAPCEFGKFEADETKPPRVTKEDMCWFQENPTLRKFPSRNPLCIYLIMLKKIWPSFLTLTNLFLKTMISSNAYFLFSLHFHIDNVALVASWQNNIFYFRRFDMWFVWCNSLI